MDLSSETPPPTTERLIFIGETIFELGAKDWLHDHYRKHNNSSLKARHRSHSIAVIKTNEIPQVKLNRISPRKAGSWGKLYKLPSRLAVATTGEQPMPKLTAGDLFVAYLGALYLSQKGLTASSNAAIVWIRSMLDYEQTEGSAESDKESLVAQHSQLQSPIKPP
ncbi:MAG TPA: hypothetical protein VGO47_10075, partial [Chlamydiales bacterium]|nr:hypothetical protein [Chlamydiales bacterium]